MLSFTLNSPKPTSTFLYSPFISVPLPHPTHTPIKFYRRNSFSVSATVIPSSSSSPPPKLYQPFRAPAPQSSIPPQFRNLDTVARLDVLTNRLGQWYEYAPLIPPLIQDGFDPSTLEEITGISGAEQNRLIVAAQVRESLVQSGVDAETLEFFDKGGAELLYEIRMLTVDQRADAARYILENKFEPNDALELSKAIKDYPLRRGYRGWDNFDQTIPADCFAFMHYRQALEYREAELRISGLEKALSVASSERAIAWITKELDGNDADGEGQGRDGGVIDGVKVPVVRLSLGEIAEATVVAMLPVSSPDDRGKEVEEAPWESRCRGDFGMVEVEKPWRRWVVLPAWEPVMRLEKGGVVVAFSDARALPWRVNRWYKEEPILVVADRSRKEIVSDDGFYLVLREDKLKVERGLTLKEKGCNHIFGSVVIVVRPPREDNDLELADEDWE